LSSLDLGRLDVPDLMKHLSLLTLRRKKGLMSLREHQERTLFRNLSCAREDFRHLPSCCE
ncbi:Hypothetical protein, putative, partial [Bodo saltans]